LMAALAVLYISYGVFFNHHFVGIFNIDNDTVVTQSMSYLRIVTAFGMAYFMVNLFNGVYDGLGKTINTFYIMAVGLGLNMALDPILILGFGMGVQGAALATGISQTVTLLIYIIIYLSPKAPAKLRFLTQTNKDEMKRIFTLGLPVGVQSMAMTIIAVYLGVLVADYGPRVMSVSRIGAMIEALSWMIAAGFQVALAAFVGQNFGAGQFNRVKQGYKTSMSLLVPYGLAINALLFFAAEPLFALFIDNEATLRHGVAYLRILSISQLFMILDMVTAGAFNGLGKTYIPSAVQIIGNGLRIPLAYLLMGMFDEPFHGIWWAISISSLFKGIVLVTLFLLHMMKLNKQGGFQSVEKTATA